jgi:hypothetical protein
MMTMINSMQGMVYCTADDGRTAITFTHVDCCEVAHTDNFSRELTAALKGFFLPNKDVCETCVDTPVPVHLTTVSQKSNSVNPVFHPVLAMVPVTIFNYDACNSLLASYLLASPNPTLTALQSIIILV